MEGKREGRREGEREDGKEEEREGRWTLPEGRACTYSRLNSC